MKYSVDDSFKNHCRALRRKNYLSQITTAFSSQFLKEACETCIWAISLSLHAKEFGPGLTCVPADYSLTYQLMQEFPYELEVLSGATQYQKWIIEEVTPYLGQRILELGSGMGNLSQWLPKRDLLVLTESDPMLFDHLVRRFETAFQSPTFKTLKVDLDHPMSHQLKPYQLDTIVSFNVMEHIKNDAQAFKEQVQVLDESSALGLKRIVTVVPAHPFAFGSFDRHFQHFRRYVAKDIKSIFTKIDPKIKVQTHYFNLLSLPGWIFTGRILKQERFDPRMIRMVEKVIPAWKRIDRVLHHKLKIPFGQSLVTIAEIPART